MELATPIPMPTMTPQATTSHVRMSDVSFRYEGGPAVLDRLHLTIPEGEVLGIVGPSGCGKSTILRLVTGLLSPTSGHVDRPHDGVDHPTSMLFQTNTVLPWLTVEENVALFARFRRNHRRPLKDRLLRRGPLHDPAISRRVAGMLEMVKLSDLAGRYPYQLSGGQVRRLNFLTAVAPQPKLLLLDEPFSSLDEPTRVGIHQDVSAVTRSMGTTVILVTHDLAEAIALSDRVVILTQRPATIGSVHTVPFGDDREMFALREHAEFLDLYAQLWHALRTQIESPS